MNLFPGNIVNIFPSIVGRGGGCYPRRKREIKSPVQSSASFVRCHSTEPPLRLIDFFFGEGGGVVFPHTEKLK